MPSTSPSCSGPPRCEQWSDSAWIVAAAAATMTAMPSASTHRGLPSAARVGEHVDPAPRRRPRTPSDRRRRPRRTPGARRGSRSRPAPHRRRARAACRGRRRRAGGRRARRRTARSRRVAGRVHEADAADRLVARLRVGPVRHAGRYGRVRARSPSPISAVGGAALRPPAEPVEQQRARPRPDRHVGEQRVQCVAEPGAARALLQRAGGFVASRASLAETAAGRSPSRPSRSRSRTALRDAGGAVVMPGGPTLGRP